MPEELTPRTVVLQLAELSKALDHTVDLLKEADLEATMARHAADVAESTAFLSAEGPVEARKHKARLATDKLEERALQAEAVCRYLKARISAIGVRVEVGRSLASALKAELQVLDYSEHP